MANPQHELALHQAAAGPAPADLANVDLSKAVFASARLAGACLCGANLREADGSGAYLKDADLSRANLQKARLVCADLRGAKLTAASLKAADLTSATLHGADLRDADLSGCRLTKALLAGADLTGATLAKADLRGARGLTPEQIRSSKGWDRAVFDPPTARALGVAHDASTARHGARRSKRSSTRPVPITVDLLFTTRRPTFGDLHTLCGEVHPSFPPSGSCDLSALGPLGFAQVDDYFAIQSDGDPVVWLYPLVRNAVASHHPGPFDGVRLQLTRADSPHVRTFLDVVTGLTEALPATLRRIDSDDDPGRPTTVAQLRGSLPGATAT